MGIEKLASKLWKSLKLVVSGALVAGATALTSPRADASTVNWNSIVRDNIEYRMQTDKSVYNLDEDVEMLYRVTNLGDESVTFNFRCLEQYSFEVKDEGSNLMWGYPGGRTTPAMSAFVLQPGEFKEYTKPDWITLKYKLSPGEYEVTGSLHPLTLIEMNRYVPVSVDIQIIPEIEILSLYLLGLSAVGYLAKRKKSL